MYHNQVTYKKGTSVSTMSKEISVISEKAGNKLKEELDNNQDVRVNQNQCSTAQNGKENYLQDLKNDNKYSNVNEDIICDEVRNIYFKKNEDNQKNKDKGNYYKKYKCK